VKPVHPTLVRQLRRAFGLRANEVDGFLADLAAAPDQPLAAGLTRLIDTLGDAYAQHDRDQVLRQRALELSSAELTTANQRLLADRASVAEAIHNLRDSARALTGRDADLAAAPSDDLVALSESLRDLARRNHEMQAQLASSEVKIRSLIANVPGLRVPAAPAPDGRGRLRVRRDRRAVGVPDRGLAPGAQGARAGGRVGLICSCAPTS
jgi:hypothetical protein